MCGTALDGVSVLVSTVVAKNEVAIHVMSVVGLAKRLVSETTLAYGLVSTSRFSPAVLPIRPLVLSLFGSLFLSSHSRWGAAPNARCYGGQGLPVISVGASDRPEKLEPVVHPEPAGKH